MIRINLSRRTRFARSTPCDSPANAAQFRGNLRPQLLIAFQPQPRTCALDLLLHIAFQVRELPRWRIVDAGPDCALRRIRQKRVIPKPNVCSPQLAAFRGSADFRYSLVASLNGFGVRAFARGPQSPQRCRETAVVQPSQRLWAKLWDFTLTRKVIGCKPCGHFLRCQLCSHFSPDSACVPASAVALI